MLQTTHPRDLEEQQALQYVRALRGFYLHLVRCLVIVTCLFALNLFLDSRRLWSLWVMAGWGIGLLAHGLRVSTPLDFLGPRWERRQVEKRLGRPL